ncbi:MAG: PASTA domain-containing protein [Eggerthellaceae bacterium]|nr:PASTA domain-containing protein [Eggerthellaceae bacterium]
MICPNCHNNNRENAKYCDECGFPLTGLIAENAQKADELLDRDLDAAAIDGSAADGADLAFSDAIKAAAEPTDEQTSENDLEGETTSPLVPVVVASDGKTLVSADQVTSSLDRLPQVVEATAPEEAALDEHEAGKADENDRDDVLTDEGETANVAPDAQAKRSDGFTDSDATSVIETTAAGAAAVGARAAQSSDITTDLAGLDVDVTEIIDERLINEGSLSVKPNWRDGHTMEMPAIDKGEAPKERSFLASSSVKQKGRFRKIALASIAALVVLGAIIAGATYYFELWGGKTVPDVTGLTQEEATEMLENSGFTVRATQVRSDGTEGLVLIEDPVGLSRQAEGSEVVIHISVPRFIPNVIGLAQEEAQKLINEEGLTNVTVETQRSDEAEGKVLAISPDQGTRVRSNQAVVIKVATPFTVPQVANMSLAEVEAAILDAGLEYGLYYTYTEDYPDYTVLGVWPEVGTKVPGGSLVTINVSRARETELLEATRKLLAPETNITIGGVNYVINSLDSVSYLGGNQTSYTITATPYITLLGENLYGTPRYLSGTITWNEDNTVAAIY